MPEPPKDWTPWSFDRGMSGGGCWKANVRPRPTSWSLSSVKLAGIHIGSRDPRRRNNGFSRKVLIGHHLKLIAKDYEDLASTINERWPQLSDDLDR
jgi:hypothetical protein